MGRGKWIKRAALRSLPALGLLGLTGYFVWNTISGERGLQSMEQRQAALKAAQQRLSEVQADETTWQRKVESLRLNHLDADALDTCARAALNLGNSNDTVVCMPESIAPANWHKKWLCDNTRTL